VIIAPGANSVGITGNSPETGTCGRHICLGLSCRATSTSASHCATVSRTTDSARCPLLRS